ncbi:MAG: hypothetical protein WA959_00285 [Rivularia sp. (in: cyanobacteria)]
MDRSLFNASIALSPKHQRKAELNAKKLSHGEKWQGWNIYDRALNEASTEQVNCWENFEYYRQYVCKHATFDHQRVWKNLLNTGQDSSCLKGIAGQDLLILSPRGSSKSTFIAEWTAYQIGMHTSPWVKISPRILYVSYDLSTAASKSRQIQSILLTNEYQSIFPWVRKSPQKWGEREWSIDFSYCGLSSTEEQYTVASAGLKGAINSRRSSLILCDDLYKSLEDATSEPIGKRLRDNWNQVLRFTRYSGSRAICIGTRFSNRDLYNDLFTFANGWQVIEQSALLEDETGQEYSYWQHGQPLAMLQAEREKDPISFSFQRQNKIVRVVEQSINPQLIVRGMLPSRFECLVLGVDLSAGTKESNDYTAMVLGGRADGKFFIVQSWEERIMGNLAKLEAIKQLWEYWSEKLPPTKTYDYQKQEYIDSHFGNFSIWFDSSAYGLSFKGDFQDYTRKHQIYDWTVKDVPASGRGSKLERLRRHTSLFENHLITFNQFASYSSTANRDPMSRLIQQITEFGSTRHDDLADALDLCLLGLRSKSSQSLDIGNY